MDAPVFVSLIIPCRNEVSFIALSLDSIMANDYPKEFLEVLVVDGMSEDGTRDIVAAYADQHRFLKMVDNPRGTTPGALNIGLKQARGRIIMRMDAHNFYPPNYISGLVAALQQTGADNVGGRWVTLASADTPVAQAIALGISHPFGVGNAYFRIGSKEPRWVDTVPFGCYRRDLFDRIGGFDEELVRNQDDEFNLRLKKSGGRILLVPEIISYYYGRDSLAKLWRMYNQYGYFKPLVARKVGGVLTLRQMVPAIFISSFLLTGILSFRLPLMQGIFAIIVGSYLVALAYFSGRAALNKGLKVGLALSLVFPAMHLSYGLGYLKGIYDFWIRRKKLNGNDLAMTPITR